MDKQIIGRLKEDSRKPKGTIVKILHYFKFCDEYRVKDLESGYEYNEKRNNVEVTYNE